MFRWNFRVSKGIDTRPASQANQITKEYYNFLVGEINRGTIKKAVAKKTHVATGTEYFHLISY